MENHQTGVLKAIDVPDRHPSELRMFSDPFELLIIETTLLEQNAVGHPNLSYVMECSREDDFLGLFVRQVHVERDLPAITGDPAAVAARVPVTQIDQRNQRRCHRQSLLRGTIFEFSDPEETVYPVDYGAHLSSSERTARRRSTRP